MTLTQQIITIAMCVLGTMATRFLPFIIFNEKRRTPEFVQYLGKFLPSEECKSVPRNPRTPGRNRYPRHRRASLLETQHADIHRRRHDMLHAPASFCLCIILLRQNIEQHNHNSKYHKDHTRHSIQCFWRCLIGNHCCCAHSALIRSSLAFIASSVIVKSFSSSHPS